MSVHLCTPITHKSPAERHQLYTFIYVHLYVSLCVVHIEYVAHTI